jgi:hypothetical protein
MPDFYPTAFDLWRCIPAGYLWAVAGSLVAEFVTVADYAVRNGGKFPARYSSRSYRLFRIAFHLFVPGLMALALLPVVFTPHEPPARAFFLAGLAAPLMISRLRAGPSPADK